MRHSQLFVYQVLLMTALYTVSVGAQQDTITAALRAEPQTAAWAQKWWMPRHKEKLAEAQQRQGQVDLLFIGDSIAHGWEGQGKAVWEEYYGRRQAFNLGFSGDRTENVLWRLQNGAIDGLAPKVAVIMIGTNNTGHRQDPAEETGAGVAAIIKELQQRTPQTKILVLAIFPRGRTKEDSLRQLNAAINQRIAKLADNKRVFFLDINKVFLERNGVQSRAIMPDLLHPNMAGYGLWARAMEPTLQTLLGEQPELPEPTVVSVWPGAVPGDRAKEPERAQPGRNDGVTRITNVSIPTLTVFKAPRRSKPGPAVMICPGGGYSILAFNLEGTEIAQWLNSIGITAVVLKYRVPKNREGALQDAQRGLSLIRQSAHEWLIDPAQVGILGFSAGGHLAAKLSNSHKKRLYSPLDEADTLSCRPDFTVLVYPSYLSNSDWDLADDVPVSVATPPAFIVQTQDDKRHVPSSLAYYKALFDQGIQAELHLYPSGGHGYGLRPSAYPVSQWPDLLSLWLGRLELSRD